jgi:putative redox protein
MANQIRVQLRQVSATASEASIRNHRTLVDRPAEKGGSDLGPMGGELFLAAVGGCFLSNLFAAIRARELNLSDVAVEVAGTLAESPARFVEIDLLVTSESAERNALERLVEIADRGCIMMNTLRATLVLRIRVGMPVDSSPS